MSHIWLKVCVCVCVYIGKVLNKINYFQSICMDISSQAKQVLYTSLLSRQLESS